MRGYRMRANNQSSVSVATASVHVVPPITTETVVELTGTFTTDLNQNTDKGPKHMKYIQQKVIPTDKTLKCESNLNDTMMQSTSQNV